MKKLTHKEMVTLLKGIGFSKDARGGGWSKKGVKEGDLQKTLKPVFAHAVSTGYKEERPKASGGQTVVRFKKGKNEIRWWSTAERVKGNFKKLTGTYTVFVDDRDAIQEASDLGGLLSSLRESSGPCGKEPRGTGRQDGSGPHREDDEDEEDERKSARRGRRRKPAQEAVGDDLGEDPPSKAGKRSRGHTRGRGSRERGYSVFGVAQQLQRKEGLAEASGDSQAAFKVLAKGLKTAALPREHGRPRKNVSPSEFMFMGPGSSHGKAVWQFKHRETRNYLWVVTTSGRIIVPKGGKFKKGFFDVPTKEQDDKLMAWSKSPEGRAAVAAYEKKQRSESVEEAVSAKELASFLKEPKGQKVSAFEMGMAFSEKPSAMTKLLNGMAKKGTLQKNGSGKKATYSLGEMLGELRGEPLDEARAKGVPGTVENFLLVMSSKLTQYDQRLSKGEMKRGGMPNIYRLGHFFGALDKVRADTRSIAKSDEQADLEKLMTSLGRRFTDFPPRRAVLKQIEQFISTGKRPSLVRK